MTFARGRRPDRVGLGAANALLAAALACLLAVPRLRTWARRPFELSDRLCLLQGRVPGTGR